MWLINTLILMKENVTIKCLSKANLLPPAKATLKFLLLEFLTLNMLEVATEQKGITQDKRAEYS